MNRAEKVKLEAKLRRDLIHVLNAIWVKTSDESFAELAERAGLSIATVTRLYYGVWKRPQFQTVQKLGHAAGYLVEFTEHGVSIRVTPKQLESIGA